MCSLLRPEEVSMKETWSEGTLLIPKMGYSFNFVKIIIKPNFLTNFFLILLREMIAIYLYHIYGFMNISNIHF